jgi:antitoxin component YwqK of YwqJK toxin-antitoxin module
MFRASYFNGDISKWDVSKVKDMSEMFRTTYFNGDISEWDTSNVENMSMMFFNSKFDGDISKWNVSKVKDMSEMFRASDFNGDISKWNVSKVKDMSHMFKDSKFDGDISNWGITNNTQTSDMKTLVSKESPSLVSRTVKYGKLKFKIDAENYNSNCKVSIYLHTDGGKLERVATRENIPGTEYVDYTKSDNERLEGNLKNVAAAEEYIKLVY